MNSFPEGIKFCYEWRSYQSRILQELDNHLANGQFHLVAPPGSGKTVLGLEVMLKINKPTLIIAPTLAIKQQWKDRFTELFLKGKQPEWISMDIKQPKFITVTTYQSLHSIYKESEVPENVEDEYADDFEPEKDEEVTQSESARIQQNIVSLGFGTLILDEAHHLRTAWWQTMMDLKESLDDVIVVALTATPPFDVSAGEWQRYVELCGSIDLEISVPELVKEKELCPHQDYVHFSAPEGEELEMILRFREETNLLVEELLGDQRIQELLENHPWMTDPMEYVTEILDHPAYFSSILIYLKHVGSDSYREALPIVGMQEVALPVFTIEWFEELLTGILFSDERITDDEDIRKQIKGRLSRIGAIERRKVMLLSTGKMNRKLTHSISKLNSISEIVKSEKRLLKEKLRMVILTDYIRLLDLPAKAGDELPLVRIGVVPIFEKIRRDVGLNVKVGVLTGSLVILPKSERSLVDEISKRHDIAVQWNMLAHDPSYIRADLNTANRQKMVSVLTEVFASGGVDVLVGTAALLGEGWDAPCVNSLIMASYVGSFMQSNQMRGRAIRVDRNNPSKTSSIWHLVCVDRDLEDPGYDYDLLARRFRSLVGVSEKEDVIETGMARLELEKPPFTPSKIKLINELTFKKSSQRNKLFERWQRAISDGQEMTEELIAERRSLPRPYFLKHSLRALSWIAGFTVLGEAFEATKFLANFGDFPIRTDLSLGIILGILLGLPSIIKVVKLYMKHPSVESSMAEIGKIIYLSLYHTKAVHTPLKEGMIHVVADGMGSYTCWLMGGTTHEKNVFMNALKEFIDPIDNPRYLIVRKVGTLIKRQDVHAVPGEIGRKKEYAQFLQAEWERSLGDSELIYTRTFEGRKELLSARMNALSAAFVEKADRISGWR